jgi:uncharacterized membrane protein
MNRHSHRTQAYAHRRMPRRQRLAVYFVSTTLWASGLLWLILDEFFSRPEQFGRTPHPLQSPLLLIHGILAIISAYVLGWISARHVLQWWSGGLRRWSGGAFAVLVVILSLSGFALFFISADAWQRLSRLTHEALGTVIVLFAVQHWFFGRRSHTPPEPRSRLAGSSHSRS